VRFIFLKCGLAWADMGFSNRGYLFIWNMVFTEKPIWVRLVALERGHKGLLQITNSELDDRKVQRYIRGNIKLLQREKRCVDFLKFLLKLGLKIYFEGIQRA